VKAIQAAKRGGYDALRLADIPRPQPRAGQALVRVTSAGVTPLDYTVLAGLHPRAVVPPLVPGNEGAGVVIEDPSGRFSAGERVLFFAGPGGVTQDGTFAEVASVPSGNLAPLPAEIPDEIAGGLPVAYLSAFLALRQAGFREGQSVLAPGVGGSVGNATLKVARALGASRLVSTAGSVAKEAAAAADGELHEVAVINLQRESLADGLARLAPRGVDIAIDALGGPITGQAVGGLARGGRAVVLGYAAGTETTLRVTDLVWKQAHVSGFSLFAASADEQAEAYAAVLPLIASGQITPAHGRSFPLEQAPEALRHLIEDRPFGKVTLTVAALSIRRHAGPDGPGQASGCPLSLFDRSGREEPRDQHAGPGGQRTDGDADHGVRQAENGLLPRMLRADGGHDHDHRGGDPGRDRVTGSAEQHDDESTGADEHRQRPGVEGQERQIDQAENEAHGGGRHPADPGGHALGEAVAQDEDRGEHRPHAAEQIVVSSH
jgi:NADPH2:quinone reductase